MAAPDVGAAVHRSCSSRSSSTCTCTCNSVDSLYSLQAWPHPLTPACRFADFYQLPARQHNPPPSLFPSHTLSTSRLIVCSCQGWRMRRRTGTPGGAGRLPLTVTWARTTL